MDADSVRRHYWKRPSTTPDGDDPRVFRVTHPYHPLSGQEFELLGYAHGWGEQRVFFSREGQGRMQSLPASWTSVVGVDPLVVIAQGRALYRADDLLTLACLLAEFGQGGCK